MLAAAPHRGAPGSPVAIGDASLGITTDRSWSRQHRVGRRSRSGVRRHPRQRRGAGTRTRSAPRRTPPTIAGPRYISKRIRRWGDVAPGADAWTVRRSRDGRRDRSRDAGSPGSAIPLLPTGPEGHLHRHGVEAGDGGVRTSRSTPDLDVIDAIVFGEYDDDTPTAIAGWRAGPSGHDGSTPWLLGRPVSLLGSSLDPRDRTIRGVRAPERFDELMAQAADRALLGDDVISLSGGTDSSAVAAYAAPVAPRAIRASARRSVGRVSAVPGRGRTGGDRAGGGSARPGAPHVRGVVEDAG